MFLVTFDRHCADVPRLPVFLCEIKQIFYFYLDFLSVPNLEEETGHFDPHCSQRRQKQKHNNITNQYKR